MSKITWTTDQRKVGDLVPWDSNPRQMTQAQAEQLEKSLQKFGLADPIIVNTDNLIIGGHMRDRILSLMDEYGPEALVDVRVPSRQLTDDEVAELNVRLNKNSGEWDMDKLADLFSMDDLMEWGFEDWELGSPAGPPDLDDLGDEYGEPDPSDFWPIIKIQVSPDVKELYDSLLSDTTGYTDGERFGNILQAVDRGAL